MQKKVAAFHDISGFGRCALTTAIPVISVMGVQCCPIPSAVLSAHTAFKGVTFRDLTDDIFPFIKNWEDIGVKLDAVYSGYLGSVKQMEQVEYLLEHCGKEGCLLIVDPVMGDNGKRYTNAREDSFVIGMRALCERADVLTPNLTECELLLGMEPGSAQDSRKPAEEYMRKLAQMGPKQIVITGLHENGEVGAGFFDAKSGELGFVFHKSIPVYYPGTGDLFTSVLTGKMLSEGGHSLETCVRAAAHFVRDCAEYTSEQGTPPIEGVLFESLLNKLAVREG